MAERFAAKMGLMSPLDALISCAGSWRGSNRVIESEAAPAEDSASAITVIPVLGRQFVRIDQTWSYRGSLQEGSLLIGCEETSAAVTIHWIDTWHLGNKVMACRGRVNDQGVFDVLGGYSAPSGPDWGWRIQIRADAPNRLRIVMFNIEPGGVEKVAVESHYNRV